MDPTKKRGLGRGLDALLPAAPVQPSRPPMSAGGVSPIAFLAPIEVLHPSRSQPRTRFDEKGLDELASSLRQLGMLEPILVRKRPSAGTGPQGFEIVAGERRWRAAQRAGLHEVPVFVRELSEVKAFEAALVENLVREDLNPLETARAYQRLLDEHEHSVDSIGKLIGKDRSTIANALRLLKLPASVVDKIEAGELSEGHGRALLSAGDERAMSKLAVEAVEKEWSVRETERRARAESHARKPPPAKSANTRDLEERLTRKLGARVTVADRKGKGHLNIAFTSYDELDRLIEVFER
jgi:ParB family transcriptional regulator, chromosome partitioning protein